MIAALESAGIRILNNQKVIIDDITFAGITYHDTETPLGLQTHLDSLELDPTIPTILMKHKPTLHSVVASYPVDLVVSGHTHQGQMFPFSLLSRAVYGRYEYGMVEQGRLTAITSSGLGSW
jgi:hypothetical protein